MSSSQPSFCLTGLHLHEYFKQHLRLTHSVYAQLSQIYTKLDFFCSVVLDQGQYSSKDAKNIIK